tara:strand:+ start:113 stop:466 length:354 start_codon:yes stop_codon:yes gene_type:complete
MYSLGKVYMFPTHEPLVQKKIMNTKLLKINAMKQFTKWLDINSVHLSLWRIYVHMPLSKIYIGLEKRDQKAKDRDQFWKARCEIRPKFKGDIFVSPRVAHFVKAEKLLNYILKRKKR